MAELKPCPFCGGEAALREQPIYIYKAIYAHCTCCKARVMESFTDAPNIDGATLGREKATEKAIEAWNRRTTIETNIYDKEETYPNCPVQVLTNTATGEVSVGWWKNGGKADEP